MTLVINISTSFQFELAKYIALPFLRMYTIKCNRRSSNFFYKKEIVPGRVTLLSIVELCP